jgi:hypothetical protein
MYKEAPINLLTPLAILEIIMHWRRRFIAPLIIGENDSLFGNYRNYGQWETTVAF